MAETFLKQLPDPLHDELRRRAAAEGTTMSDLVIRMLRVQLSLPSTREWLAEVEATRRGAPIEVDMAALMAAVRDEETGC
jgi:plasmid stability protein